MNNRDYKKFAPNSYFHIYNRGVNKQNIFYDKEDIKFFLWRFKENLFPSQILTPDGNHLGNAHTPYVRKFLPEGAFDLVCYCLMPNHFHLLIKQNTELPVSKLVLKVCTSYSKFFNKRHERVGPLFQDSFKAVNIETGEYLKWLSAYIHNNPRTSGMIENLQDYPWSSYPDYIGIRNGTLCSKDIVLNQYSSLNEYIEFVNIAQVLIHQKKSLEYLLLD